jgi:diacylglycerol kinase (ATP)
MATAELAGPKRALLVRNPGSKQGDAPIDAALARFAERGVAVTELPFSSPQEACSRIEADGSGFDCVIVGGGDGTLNGVAPAVLKSRKPLGILPMGTANDLARTLEIPVDLAKAADIIADGRRRCIDVGLANGLPFFNVASLGLSAELAETLDSGTKRRFGQVGYALAGLRVLRKARTFRAVIASAHETVRVTTYQIAVGNGRYYGGGVAVRPDAAIDDALLDLYSLEPGSLWKVILTAPLFKRGHHGVFREVRTARGRKLEIRTGAPMPVNLDGELATETPLILEVMPAALEVYAPDVA